MVIKEIIQPREECLQSDLTLLGFQFMQCLRYKVDAIPPVSETPESVAQPEG